MKEQPVINIALASDKPLLFDSIKWFLAPFDTFLLTTAAISSLTLLNLIENALIKPNICILDIDMADLVPCNIITEINQRWPEIKIVAITMNENEHTTSAILQKGITGYLPHSFTNEDTYNALLAVYENRSYPFHITTFELVMPHPFLPNKS